MTGTQRLGSEVSIDSPTAERHMGHIDTSAAQTAHILRWRHGSSTMVAGARTRSLTRFSFPHIFKLCSQNASSASGNEIQQRKKAVKEKRGC